jgi:hypothetical protein
MPVLITRSSHVRRLQDYEEARHAFKNFAIDNINVEFQGIGGGRVMDSELLVIKTGIMKFT